MILNANFAENFSTKQTLLAGIVLDKVNFQFEIWLIIVNQAD